MNTLLERQRAGLSGAASSSCPHSDSSYFEGGTLGQNAQGFAVRDLQADLVALGYNVGSAGTDGIFGPATAAALRSFQGDAGVAVSGTTDAATRAALCAALAPSTGGGGATGGLAGIPWGLVATGALAVGIGAAALRSSSRSNS